MRERVLDGFQLSASSENEIELINKAGYRLQVSAIDAQRLVYRVRVIGKDRALPINSFFKHYHDGSEHIENVSGANDSKIENSSTTSATIHCGSTVATLDWSSATACPLLTILDKDDGAILHQDLQYRSYNLTAHGVRHYITMNRKDIHFGLGEVAAPLDLSGRKIEIRTSDAAAYDSWLSDPLYKHTPYLIKVPAAVTSQNPGQPVKCTAYYSTSHADSIWDIGKSIDEPWGAYKTFETETGGLDMYIFCGDLQNVSATLAHLTGALPLMPPRWSLGYISSPMGLAAVDNPSAQALLERFLQDLQANDIPTSAIHFSSSYTVTETPKGFARNVFTLNEKRMPDFSGFCKKAHELGMRVVPNIKPYLNIWHPAFSQLEEQNGLFYDPDTGSAVRTYIWSMGIGEKLQGGWIDTSSQAGFQWWYEGVCKLIEMGVDGLWNDNDEYSLHDDAYLAAWNLQGLPGQDGHPKPVGLVGRTFFTELLGRSSWQALRDRSQGRRPYILTRSANLNTMQYACSTWSGDNRTDWATLKGNCIMAINASLSLYHSYGSDVGGFAGPVPDVELFVRWCQVAAYHTRFCINSIHVNPADDDQFAVNSPWQHKSGLDRVRAAIKRRYELLPYMYGLHHEGRIASTPPVSFLGMGDYQSDPALFKSGNLHGDPHFWLGTGRLLVAGVFEAGQKTKQVYLPKSSANDTEQYYQLFPPYAQCQAGMTVEISLDADHIPVFARAGSVIPVGKPCATITSDYANSTNDGTSIRTLPGFVETDNWRGIEIFPSLATTRHYTGEWIEDDGERAWPCPVTVVAVEYWSDERGVHVQAKFTQKGFVPLWQSLWVILPMDDNRQVVTAISSAKHHRTGRPIFEIEVA